ncbi:MAG TPA: arginine--tRNA ligase [Candidatus Krumholzibacteriaceae bacterium]|nr:arginine--tRNA ligase [Candidatus Krumholzibacteriaceae bacterium]
MVKKAGFEDAGVRERITGMLFESVKELELDIERDEIQLERPKELVNGDLSSNIALVTAGKIKSNPRKLAETIIDKISSDPDFISEIEVAGPGFINFFFSADYLKYQVLKINREQESYGDLDIGKGKKVQIEFVSANPTGPLVLVSARAAAVGSALVRLYCKAGFEVDSEYYLNDSGKQVHKLGLSLMARFRQNCGEDARIPEGGYPGEYLIEIAKQVPEREGMEWLGLEADRGAAKFADFALERMVELIKKDLEVFGVSFDHFFAESSLHRSDGEVDKALEIMKDNGFIYENDDALWFRSTDFGDEKDRVVIRSDRSPTYFLADAAYHLNKLRRGYDRVIDIFGPDHHGHIQRLKAASSVFGAEEDWLEILTVQWVRLIEEGKEISMSKRRGEYITLNDLISDVGKDAAKFFFLMRKNHAHMDFDLSLARKKSDENPVYYVQYAHARISSVISFAKENDVEFPEDLECVELLDEPEELDLIRKLIVFPQLVEGAVLMNDPNRLTTYTREIASSFHHFYHICRIISDNNRLSQARLLLSEATRIVLAESLRLIGVAAPRKM